MIHRTFYYFLCLMTIIIFFSSLDVQAKNDAWLLDIQGTADKLDVDINRSIKKISLDGNPRISVSLQDVDQAVVADKSSNLLVLVNDFGRIGQWIGIYSLKDMTFKKRLEIESYDPHLNLPKILLPPKGNNFYLVWWDKKKELNGVGGETYSVYDKITLNRISDLATFPVDIHSPWRFSSDGTKIYSINIDNNEIKIHDSATLQLLDTISILNIWGTPIFGKGMENFNNDRALFVENIKSNDNDPNKYWYFTYQIPSKEVSRKTSVAEAGSGVMTADGSKLIILGSSSGQTKNKIYIYDLITGQKLKELDFNNEYEDIRILRMQCINGDDSKLYLQGEKKPSGSTTLIIIDLKGTFSKIAELPNIEGSRMIFFNE